MHRSSNDDMFSKETLPVVVAYLMKGCIYSHAPSSFLEEHGLPQQSDIIDVIGLDPRSKTCLCISTAFYNSLRVNQEVSSKLLAFSKQYNVKVLIVVPERTRMHNIGGISCYKLIRRDIQLIKNRMASIDQNVLALEEYLIEFIKQPTITKDSTDKYFSPTRLSNPDVYVNMIAKLIGITSMKAKFDTTLYNTAGPIIDDQLNYFISSLRAHINNIPSSKDMEDMLTRVVLFSVRPDVASYIVSKGIALKEEISKLRDIIDTVRMERKEEGKKLINRLKRLNVDYIVSEPKSGSEASIELSGVFEELMETDNKFTIVVMPSRTADRVQQYLEKKKLVQSDEQAGCSIL